MIMIKKMLPLLFLATNVFAANPIGTLGTTDNVTIGGRQFPNAGGSTTALLGPIITLIAVNGSNGGATFRTAGSHVASGHLVPAAKTLYCYAISVSSQSAQQPVSLCQSDNDIGFNSATALTNPVCMGSESSTTTSFPIYATSSVTTTFPIYVTVNTGKYMTWNNNGAAGGAGAIAWCYEY